jgi:hypothetical protein
MPNLMWARSAPRAVELRRIFAFALGALIGNSKWPKRIHYGSLCIGLGIFIGCAAHATTIKEVDFSEAVNGSELVFEGVVISKHSSISPVTGQPFTYFMFHIQDVIKGTYREQTITLGYLGGPKDDRFLVVSGMKMPEVGESGIYFVESLSRQQVHPLYGWQQWHLQKYVDTDGVTKVRHLQPPRGSTPLAASSSPTVDQVKDAIRATAGQRR